ncbi:MAG: gephyrin-like molybdotransferase Glp [Candidatus Limnocylindria bacterium]
MLSVDEALTRLLEGVRSTDAEPVDLADAAGRVLVDHELVAAADVPPFANSAMDGFAIRSGDGAAERRIIGESRAGGPPSPPVADGTAVRIMTGAPVPPGADSVVPVEDVIEAGERISTTAAPRAGAHVRPAGLDFVAGQRIRIARGPLTPSGIGLLATLGRAVVDVRRRPRVAILSTGDELVDVGAELAPGQIHDANAPALAAAVGEAGGQPVVVARAPDDPAAIEQCIRRATDGADLLVVSGGVSVGAHDHVRSVIEQLGTLDFWRIAVQPGKPLAFGRIGAVPVIGLPGNPVSALVTFELFVRPMIRAMLGLVGDGRVRVDARVDEEIAKDPARRAYLRVRLDASLDGFRARSSGGQGSSQLLPLAVANALLVVPEGAAATESGARYQAIVLGSSE